MTASSASSRVDGRSLLGLAKGEEGSGWRQYAYSELLGESGNIPTWRAVYTKEYAYHYWLDTGEEELYALNQDPYELDNLVVVDHAAAEGHVSELRHVAEEMFTCAGEGCRDAETR